MRFPGSEGERGAPGRTELDRRATDGDGSDRGCGEDYDPDRGPEHSLGGATTGYGGARPDTRQCPRGPALPQVRRVY